MKELTKRVKKLMQDKERCRDEKQYLLASFWNQEIHLRDLTAVDFLRALISKKISSPESILRAQRKVLEECPHLRGPNYGKRQRLKEEYPEKQLKEMKEVLSD